MAFGSRAGGAGSVVFDLGGGDLFFVACELVCALARFKQTRNDNSNIGPVDERLTMTTS